MFIKPPQSPYQGEVDMTPPDKGIEGVNVFTDIFGDFSGFFEDF